MQRSMHTAIEYVSPARAVDSVSLKASTCLMRPAIVAMSSNRVGIDSSFLKAAMSNSWPSSTAPASMLATQNANANTNKQLTGRPSAALWQTHQPSCHMLKLSLQSPDAMICAIDIANALIAADMLEESHAKCMVALRPETAICAHPFLPFTPKIQAFS